tara:strand:+ start:1001 stop:1822 length:822 start_codon:yes stop_codon:yes gene_type:complete
MDIFIYNEVLKFYDNKENLFFVDIGANNGKFRSNTYYLEEMYKWEGICVEALPYYFNSLRNRRKSFCDNSLVFYNSNKDIYYTKHNFYFNEKIKEYINYHHDNHDGSIKLKTITLNDLLKKYDAPRKINYMTINSKGKEICILNSVNLKNYKFLYLSIEHNFTEPRRSNIRDLLEKYGYLYINSIGWYDNYTHEDIINGIYYLNENINENKKIEIRRLDKYTFYLVSSCLEFENDICSINSLEIHWERLDLTGKVYYDRIDYGNGLVWYKDLT